MIQRRCQVHEQHGRGKDYRTEDKRDVAMVERCQNKNRSADHRAYQPDPMADTIRYLLASRLCPVSQGQRIINSIHRTRSCNAYWAYFAKQKFVSWDPTLDITLGG
jgi:hypothetical protein